MKEVIGNAIGAAAAAILLVYSHISARDALAGLPPLPVRGAPLVSTVETREGEQAVVARVEGDGTAESPARIPFSFFAFPSYDPASLRIDKTPILADSFPEALRPYHGKIVEIRGFMLAVELDGDDVKTFILSRYPQGCCFGAIPVFDEWIDVKVGDGSQDAFEDLRREVTVTGPLEMGEVTDEQGRVQSIYRMQDAVVERRY